MFSFFSKDKSAKSGGTKSGNTRSGDAPTLADTTKLVAAPGRKSTVIEGEAVIMDPGSGQYFSLNPVGARAWDLVQQPRALGDIRQVILGEYDVDEGRCQNDLVALFSELEREGLVKIVDSNPA